MKQVFKYDLDGKYIEPVIIFPDENGVYIIPTDCTDKELPQPNWLPVFDKVKKVWVETISDAEKTALQNIEQPKSEIEILKEQNSDLNLQIIEIWETLINGGVA